MRRDDEPIEVPGELEIAIGKRLRMARFRAKLTQRQLARRVGTDEAEIERWETGASVIYSEELQALCVALNVTPNQLLGWKE